MSEMTIKSFVQQSIDKYLEKIHNLCKDSTSSKMERIKNTIYKMVMECLETSLPLSIKTDPEIYVELTNIIIPDIVSNYNEFLSRLPFSMFSLFIVLSGYFLNIICSTIFPVVPFTYFESFPMLIRVFCCISMFIILFSILFILSSIFSNLFSIRFIALNISTFLASILFWFFNSIFHKFFPIII